ncbi:hypothetical protein [Pseudorhodobacter ferrugineus]|uniref:hypothetical protein n=1 Tax=Pseudorhodobacter ferrugineus TaxID=77008 RepID=UPI000B2E0D94|nr:hypothetical protein [Pseudorhodobacter ferrugineus]
MTASTAEKPARPALAEVAPARPIPVAQPQNTTAVRKPVARARFKLRHHLLLISFVFCVLLPPGLVAWYLWTRAADQYHSRIGFAVRLEQQTSALSFLSGLTGISNSSSSDTDILFEFIPSQRLVADIDAEIDLRKIWSRPQNDPVFAIAPDATLEELVDYWNVMVKLSRGKGGGLLEVEARAFDPEDALRITTSLFEKSSEMINELSSIAREDAITNAFDDLTEAKERLKTAREAVTKFRNVNQLVNPQLDLQTQAGLLGNLQAQQAAALIALDLLQDATKANDPRVVQAERRLVVIETRIDAERRKLGIGGGDGTQSGMADIMGEYERLTVELEFAERTYTTALASYDASLAEARRKSRYLAAYMQPTKAESSIYPERPTLLGTIALFLFLSWSIGALVYYSIRDRR